MFEGCVTGRIGYKKEQKYESLDSYFCYIGGIYDIITFFVWSLLYCTSE